MVHHYAEYMDVGHLEEAREDLCELIEGYQALEKGGTKKKKMKSKKTTKGGSGPLFW